MERQKAKPRRVFACAVLLASLLSGFGSSLALGGSDETPSDQGTTTQQTTAAGETQTTTETTSTETTSPETTTETTSTQTTTDTPPTETTSGQTTPTTPVSQGGGRSFIVVLKDSTSDPETVAKEHGRRFGVVTDFVYTRAIKGYAARLSAQQLDQVRQDPAVQFVSEDRPVKATATEPLASGDSAPTGVRRIGAPDTTTVHKSSTAAVAVIDTGIALSHPDLNAAAGKNCVRTKRSPNDDNGHGSHVAGTIAAKNNGSGVVGVAPNTKLYA